MSIALGILVLVLLGLLTLVSYVERIHTEAGKFLSREFQENIEAYEQLVEPRLHVNRDRASLAVAVLEELTNGAVAMVIAYSVFLRGAGAPPGFVQAARRGILSLPGFHRRVPLFLVFRPQ